MAYVDLNQIRASMAQIPEKFDHTSVQKRIESATDAKQQKATLFCHVRLCQKGYYLSLNRILN
ncbi:hypothetical protein ATS76_18680 [Pseudoalteromonas sp. 10-33]|jgi:hypothetical protein|nr:hypothetical protein ATS76_18680 [Pseudoalteromonas sp. 10-33]